MREGLGDDCESAFDELESVLSAISETYRGCMPIIVCGRVDQSHFQNTRTVTLTTIGASARPIQVDIITNLVVLSATGTMVK